MGNGTLSCKDSVLMYIMPVGYGLWWYTYQVHTLITGWRMGISTHTFIYVTADHS